MYSVDLKSYKKGYGFSFMFGILGTILLVVFGAIFLSGYIRKIFLDSETEAIVSENCNLTDEGVTCSPTYSFTVDGKLYDCGTIFSSDVKFDLDKNIVYYDSNNPYDCVTQASLLNFWIILLILFVPILFIIFALVVFIKTFKSVKKVKYLLSNGKLIKDLPYQLINTNTYINGRRLQKIEVNYNTSVGNKLISNSKIISERREFVDLLIDPADDTNYIIEFDIKRV